MRGEINAAWFGATGNTGKPARAAIQAALDLAASQAKYVTEHKGDSAPFSFPTVRLPDGGVFEIEGDEGLRPGPYVRLVGNRTHLWSNSTVAPIITANGHCFDIEGITFSGGNGHIKLTGSEQAQNAMRMRFLGCRFNRTATGEASLVFDPADPDWQPRTLSAFLMFRDCFHDACCAFRGSCDDIVIENEMANWATREGPWFDGVGNIRINNVQGTPLYYPGDVPTENAWLKVGGTLSCRGFRFGGESGGGRILHYHDESENVWGAWNGVVSFRDCQMFYAGTSWAKFGGGFPTLDIGPCQGFLPGPAEVDSAAEASLRFGRSQGLTVRINPGSSDFSRLFKRPDGTVIEELTALQQKSETTTEKPTTQSNLFPAGVFDAGQLGMPSNLGVEITGTVEHLGKALTVYSATQANGGAYFALANALSGLPAGTYCLSLFVATTGSCVLCPTVYGVGLKKHSLGNTGGDFRRIAFVFYWDGVGDTEIRFSLEGMAEGKTAAFGLFEIVRGTEPSPEYVVP